MIRLLSFKLSPVENGVYSIRKEFAYRPLSTMERGENTFDRVASLDNESNPLETFCK